MSHQEVNNLVEFLSTVAFFSEVSHNSLQELCKSVEILNFIKNETVIKKDDEGDAMYVILKGDVKVHDNNHIYGHLSKSDCFGEYAMIDNKKRSASVTTISRSEVIKIGG